MTSSYLWLKFLHIVVAVVALGTSAGLGIVLEFFGDDPTHGPFVLRAIERMIALLVLPGFLLMLATGLWMAGLAWPFTARWLQLALGLWLVVSAAWVGRLPPFEGNGACTPAKAAPRLSTRGLPSRAGSRAAPLGSWLLPLST